MKQYRGIPVFRHACMAGGKRKHNGRMAQLSLLDEKVLAYMEPVKDLEDAAPADPASAALPLPAETPPIGLPAKEQDAPPPGVSG